METDCQLLVEALYSGSMENSGLGFLLSDLKESLSLAYNARVIFTKREVNCVAHSLAQLVLFSCMSTCFTIVILSHVEDIISFDCNDP